jgi:hypothetical protein
MKADILICGNDLEVEYDFTITASGAPESWSAYGGDPAEPAEFDIEVLSVSFPKQAADVTLEIPAWLNDLIVTHLCEREDICTIVQQADQERGNYDPDDDRD